MLQIQICVPNSSVGAIIGAGGSNIKQIIRDSNAFVTIEPKRDDDPNPAAERTVTIKGSMDAQWRVRTLSPSITSESDIVSNGYKDIFQTKGKRICLKTGCILSLSLGVRFHLY